jgi:hypothetical protein
MFFAGQAAGQTVLYGVRPSGDLLRVDTTTGAGAVMGRSGVACAAAAAMIDDEPRAPALFDAMLLGGGPAAQADQLTAINRWSGAVARTLQTTGRPVGYTIRAMAVPQSAHGLIGPLSVLLGDGTSTTIELLATIDVWSGVYTVIGPTGRTDLQSLAWNSSGALYALGTDGGGSLCRVDPSTGAATLIGGGEFGADDQALAFLPDGRLVACGANLLSVDAATGATTLIGPTGFTDIIALAQVAVCYANCDHQDSPPILNITDFICFQTKFAAGDPSANCDLSTSPPLLNVNDFVCFMAAFTSAANCHY